MADLKVIQDRLNSDPALRSQFFQDPVKFLEGEGVILPDAAKTSLKGLVAQLANKPTPVAGSTLHEFADVNIIMNIQTP